MPAMLPRVWSREELAAHREAAVAVFVSWYEAKGTNAYRAYYELASQAVVRLFDATNDLIGLDGAALKGIGPELRVAARYLAGPPLSDDDLRTLSGVRNPWIDTNVERAADVILRSRDPVRFPWLLADPARPPTSEERSVAVQWTAGLMAAQMASTERRGESSRRQERSVADALATASVSYTKVAAHPIHSVRDLAIGEYCGQSLVGGTRADQSIGLYDGRLLLLECKVSNSEVNSYKRLIHEVGNKVEKWRRAFGDQAIGGAVLAGSFSLENLISAQRAGIALFWEADLSSLVGFVDAAR